MLTKKKREIKKMFYKFLIERNLMIKFKENLFEDSGMTIQYFMSITKPESFVIGSFNWSIDKSRYNWGNLHDEWLEMLNIYYENND